MTKNKADEEINPVARDETETERKERMMEILGQQEEEEEEEKGKVSRGDGVKETEADMLSPGVLRVLLIHNSPPWQTFIHILTPHGCAQWSSRSSTSLPLSMDTPVERRSVSPLSCFTLETVEAGTENTLLVLDTSSFSVGISDVRLNCVN